MDIALEEVKSLGELPEAPPPSGTESLPSNFQLPGRKHVVV